MTPVLIVSTLPARHADPCRILADLRRMGPLPFEPRRMRLGHDLHRQAQPVQHTKGVVEREDSVGLGSGRDMGSVPQSRVREAVRPIFHDSEITRCNADGLPLMPFDGLLHPVPPVPTNLAGYGDTASLGLRRRDILIKFFRNF